MLKITRSTVNLRLDFFLCSQLSKAEMNLIPTAVKNFVKRFLQKMMKWLPIEDLGPKRPFMSLFLGTFLIAGFLPLLMYLVFVSVVACLGGFLFAIIEGGIIVVATVTLMAALILPACIAGGLALFVFSVHFVFTQIKSFLGFAVNVPEKRLGGDGFKSDVKGEFLDEKPEFLGKARFRPGKKTSRDASDGEADDADETRSAVLPGALEKKLPVTPHA